MRLITVEGEGRVSQSPDTIELNVELVSLNKEYEKAMAEAVNKLNILYTQLSNVGFEKADIKTSSFTINAKYENIRDNYGNIKNEFVGYEVRHNLIIRFPYDINLLGETLNAITRSITKPNINILFTIEDKQPLITKLLESAVEDAISKAKTLTNASGVQLGEIQNIEYRSETHRIFSDTNLAPTVAYSMEKLDIVPKDIELRERVKITFEIK